MKFDTTLLVPQLDSVGAFAESAEKIGFDALWISETNSDPFLNLTLAAQQTSSIELGSGIAVAFPRSPHVLAMTAFELARYSKGRFILGLGTQVRAHNQRRLGAIWEKPVRKMRETIEAIHALWDTWQDGTKLDYKGEFFNLNLMTPFFTPAPLETGKPDIFIAAVNENMLRLVGKRCDGVFLHALHTRRYIEHYAKPHIRDGLRQSGRNWDDVTLMTAVFAVPTDDVKPASEHELFAKQQISFYMSTPAYRIVAELHGWEAIALQLSKHARAGEWAKMPVLINDEIMSEMTVTGTWAQMGRETRHRYDGLVDRIGYYIPYEPTISDDGWRATLNAFAHRRAIQPD